MQNINDPRQQRLFDPFERMCSNDMASFVRTRLMGVTVKRFLTQVKRHGIGDIRNTAGRVACTQPVISKPSFC